MKKRICFFTTYFDYPRERTMQCYERILPKDVDIFLFCQQGEQNKFNLDRTKKFGYTSGKMFVFRELRKFCKTHQITSLTCLAGGSKIGIMMGLATRGTKTKNIFYAHGDPSTLSLLGLFPFQFLVDRILACTEGITKKYRSFMLFNKSKVDCLPIPINTKLFHPDNKIYTRKRLKLNSEKQVIIYVGRIQYMKGSDYLLKIIKQNHNKTFVLVGALMDNNYNPKELKNVIFIPKANAKELVSYYSSADLCLFLSRREGFGIAFREAMACNVPTVVSNVSSLRNSIGTIKVNLDVKEIQQKIDNFFSQSNATIANQREQARKAILKNYSEIKLKDLHKKLFLGI